MTTRPETGGTYDLAFPARPDLGVVRVKVLGGDQPLPRTSCGAEGIYIEIISGQIPMANPDRMVGPGDVTAIAIIIPTWSKVQ